MDIGMKPTVSIIGTGMMGSGLAHGLAKAGYRVLIGSSSTVKRDELAAAIRRDVFRADIEVLDCSRESSWEADIIIPAVPYSAQAEVAAHIKDVVTGKIVISLVNPLNATYDGLLTPATTSAAEELAALLPDSKIVKAFNTVFSGTLINPVIQGDQADTFIAANDADATATIAQMASDIGFNPLFAGKLDISRTLELMAALLIGLNIRNGYQGIAGWKVLHNAA